VDQSLEGRHGVPFEMVIELGKVREMARATRSDDPDHLEGRYIPPTFLMSAALWTDPENSPWTDAAVDLRRLLHGEQEFVFFGPPPPVGTRLMASSRIERIYEKQGKRGGAMQFGLAVTEFRDAATDEVVAESRVTLIETGQVVTTDGAR
jgi:hypothetical protein